MPKNCNGGRKGLRYIRKVQLQHWCHVLLPLIVLSTCCARFAHTMEYSAKLTNCYDVHAGFDERLLDANATTATIIQSPPLQQLQRHDGVLLEVEHAAPETAADAALKLPAAAKTMMMTINAYETHHTSGWKCCCWNATNQNEVECRCEGDALTRVPQTLTVPVQRLTIASAGLPRLRSVGLKVYAASLLDIVMTDLQLLGCIENSAFAGLKLLRTIYISHAPQLTFLAKDVFLGISDTIKIIRIINSGLTIIPELIHLPPENILQMLDLDNNHITRIAMKSIRLKTDQLILANNDISYIDDSAFYGSQIAKLILKENRNLREVHPNAFSGMSMQELDLSSTSLVRLPSVGLQDIEELRIENTHTLKTIPSIYNLKNLQRAYLTHSFHCCAFKFPSRHDPRRHAERMEEIEKWQRQCTKSESDIIANANSDNLRRLGVKETESGDSSQEWRNANGARLNLELINPTHSNGILYSRLERTDLAVSSELNETEATTDYDDDYISESMIKDIGVFHAEITIDPEETQLDEYCGNFTFRKHNVACYPMPNALNPCEDVMGYQWLRIAVWIVVSLAVVGNVAVLVVILSIKSESSSVPRFLMRHLAFADLCLGLYLLLIAAIDAHSMGEYFNYAYDWQYGAGCKVAGFLTVFASLLSVFTLTVITIERWMAITHAMNLNRRIKLRPAAYIMICGWIYSLVMSTLPLFGISNYSSTSICLPMEIRDLYDVVYLVAVLGLNGAAFFIIAICYGQIYLSLGKETRNAHLGEMSVAKKMALLVFTNFACWAPIAFFALTALAGYPLINVTKSKILLVFFYPMNSCADPYLYAILTTQYRQDLYALLSKFGPCKRCMLKYDDSFSQPGTGNLIVHASSITHRSSLSSKIQSQQPIKSTEMQCMLRNEEDFV